MMLKFRLRTHLFVSVFLLIMTAIGTSANAQQAFALRAALGKREITPSVAVKNWVTGKSYTHINDSLYLKTLILHDGRTKSAIVTVDLVDAGESLTHEIRKVISNSIDIPYDHILVNASHSHSAPWAPIYTDEFRGKERDTWWAIRYMPAQNMDTHYSAWMKKIIIQAEESAKEANAALQPVSISISKTDAAEFMNNRRPIKPAWGIGEQKIPKGYNYTHAEWDPDVLTGGYSFGPVDRTMTLLSFKNKAGQNIVTLFHAAIHSVAIYPFSQEISGDWPGDASRKIAVTLGGEAMFLQGAAGDINPARRGREAVDNMTTKLALKAQNAVKFSSEIQSDSLIIKRGVAGLPLDQKGKQRTGLDAVNAEVQVMAFGPVAFVTLPGEPLTDLGELIRKRSPFPQTLVLGYSNGNGVHYVGLPEDMQKGGYEMELGTVGTSESGIILTELANRLLLEAIQDKR